MKLSFSVVVLLLQFVCLQADACPNAKQYEFGRIKLSNTAILTQNFAADPSYEDLRTIDLVTGDSFDIDSTSLMNEGVNESRLKLTVKEVMTRKSGIRKAVYQVTEHMIGSEPKSYIVTVTGWTFGEEGCGEVTKDPIP